jgi:hypothetical protein
MLKNKIMTIGIIAILIASAWFCYNSNTTKLYMQVKNWDRVEAKILSKNEVLYENTASVVEKRYTLKVEYEYQINNITYKGNTYQFTEIIGKYKDLYKSYEANQILTSINNKMLIYVNPNNPNESTLLIRGILSYLVLWIVVTVFITLAYIIAFLFIKNILDLMGILFLNKL